MKRCEKCGLIQMYAWIPVDPSHVGQWCECVRPVEPQRED